MRFERLTSEGLSHHSYLLADGGEAVIVDPSRDVDRYLDRAERLGLRIRTVVETHRNEDYAIGSTALAQATECEILHSSRTRFGYGTPIGDGDTFGLGNLEIRAIETPGHTPDSLTYAVADLRAGRAPVLAFTGDTLFVQEVGRTDLLGPEHARECAESLWEALFRRVLPLGDGVVLYPAHGGGSVCGGNISDREISTIGFERLHNPKLQRADKQAFVRGQLAERHVVPRYFRRMEDWNLHGTAPVHLRVPVPPPLSPDLFAAHVADGAIVLDARMPQAFAGAHVPGSLNVWADGLATYAGQVLPLDARVVLILPEHARIVDVARTLYRVGQDRVQGWLVGGFEAWQNQGRELARVEPLSTPAVEARLRAGAVVLDVRNPGESANDTVPGALRIPLAELEDRLDEVPRDRDVIVMCSVGHRGSTGASVLLRNGWPRVANYLGGFTAWQQTHR